MGRFRSATSTGANLARQGSRRLQALKQLVLRIEAAVRGGVVNVACSTMSPAGWTHVAIPACAFAVLLGYHVKIWCCDTARPTSARMTKPMLMRQVWGAWVAEHHCKGMVPINTFRDIVRTFQWYGGLALVSATTLLGILSPSVRDCANELNTCPADEAMRLAKVFLLTTLFVTIFVCETQAVRLIIHAELLVNIAKVGSIDITPDIVAKWISDAMLFNSFAKRGFLLAIPLLLWLLGDACFLLGSIAIIAFESSTDSVSVELHLGGGAYGSVNREGDGTRLLSAV